MKNSQLLITLSLLFILTSMETAPIFALNAVASLKKVDGHVQVERGTSNNTLIGRMGLILKDQDTIITGDRSKATILFRDGSEIRVFQKTRFTISNSKESELSGSRILINKLILKLGSFWGKFTKGKQNTFIETPTATAGIKGTIVSFKEQNGKFSASLAMGSVTIENDDNSIVLNPGTMVNEITKTGSIQDKIVGLPYQIQINPDQQKIDIPGEGEESTVYLSLQIINVKTNKNVNQNGPIYLSVDSDRLEFPNRISLNKRGYTRIKAKVKPFSKKDYKNGKVEIIAIMDGEKFINVSSGHTFLTYDMPKSSIKTFKIDSQSGGIEQ
jgi:hypothetical protein